MEEDEWKEDDRGRRGKGKNLKKKLREECRGREGSK